MWDALDPAVMLGSELSQRREAGYEVAAVEPEILSAVDAGAPEDLERAYRLLEATEIRSDWPFEEPSSLEAILRVCPGAAPEAPPPPLDRRVVGDRILAGWLGRCAGCNLGKPVEGWSRARIRRYLDLAGAFPITDYLPVLESDDSELNLNDCWTETTRGNVSGMARDDDIDYTILALHSAETSGPDVGSAEIAAEWLDHLPFGQVYTAERVAYRNLVDGFGPPSSASRRNPYREWIGAQIRADLWGYVSPGDPRRAAEAAFRDASISHTENGIYGEMWIGALIAASFVTDDVPSALEISLGWIPSRSRLATAIRDVLALAASGADWSEARDAIEERYGRYSGVHTINNAAVVALALLWGDDFSRTIGLAVEGGWDADCNGATAGSVFGVMHGTESLPGHWVSPLDDSVRSSISGFDRSRISDLAARTTRLAMSALDPQS
jgi:ADP-ribosylglycohydrolase